MMRVEEQANHTLPLPIAIRLARADFYIFKKKKKCDISEEVNEVLSQKLG